MPDAQVKRYQFATIYGTIIVPVLNDAAYMGRCLAALRVLRTQGWKVVVVDGGSYDNTIEIAQSDADEVIAALPGRANQMNAGSRLSQGEVLVFLSVENLLPATFSADMAIFIESDAEWGRFDIRFTNPRCMFRVIAAVINERSRLTSVATNDQALFFKRDFFRKLGGFPLIPVMEDTAIGKAARKLSLPLCIRSRVLASSHRWEQKGITRTLLFAWAMQLGYFFGVSPQRLGAWSRQK